MWQKPTKLNVKYWQIILHFSVVIIVNKQWTPSQPCCPGTSGCFERWSIFWRCLLLHIAGGEGSTMAALLLNRNISCSDKVQLTGSSGFSSILAVPGPPWGISSMPPIETPSANMANPILQWFYTLLSDWLRGGWGELAKVQHRAVWAQYGVYMGRGGGWEGGDVGSGHN